MKEIAVVTPVYNRANRIAVLYKSLLLQTKNNFEWIIIDDGSTDNISDVVSSFDGTINITFISQRNGGKCSALNTALDYCKADYFFVVDSDDYLKSDAIEKLYSAISNIPSTKNIVGIVAYRVFSDGQISGRRFPEDKLSVGYNELNYHFNQDGETALIYKTELLRLHKHKVFSDERFLSEEIQYNEIDVLGNLWFLKEPLIVMEYLEDGLTNNYFKNWLKNPKGTKLLLNSKYAAVKGLTFVDVLIKKAKTLIQYDVLAMHSSEFTIHESPNPVMAIFLFPLAAILKKRICKENIKNGRNCNIEL